MNKVLSPLIICLALIFCSNTLTSQVNIVSSNNLNFVDSTDRTTYRTPQSKDIAIVINSTINDEFFFNQVGSDILDEDESGINRLVEQFTPSYRYYLDAKTCVTVGVLLSRKTQNVIGEFMDTLTYQSLEMNSKSRSVSLRFAYDKHNKPVYFRHFDLDTYFGAALSIGRTKSKETLNEDYYEGDYSYETITTPGNAAGGELYTGVSLRFDNISVGFELLALGFDHQWGFGKSSVDYDYSLGQQTEAGSYFVNSGDLPVQFTGDFASLNARSTTTSMYRGIRLNISLYLK